MHCASHNRNHSAPSHLPYGLPGQAKHTACALRWIRSPFSLACAEAAPILSCSCWRSNLLSCACTGVVLRIISPYLYRSSCFLDLSLSICPCDSLLRAHLWPGCRPSECQILNSCFRAMVGDLWQPDKLCKQPSAQSASERQSCNPADGN